MPQRLLPCEFVVLVMNLSGASPTAVVPSSALSPKSPKYFLAPFLPRITIDVGFIHVPPQTFALAHLEGTPPALCRCINGRDRLPETLALFLRKVIGNLISPDLKLFPGLLPARVPSLAHLLTICPGALHLFLRQLRMGQPIRKKVATLRAALGVLVPAPKKRRLALMLNLTVDVAPTRIRAYMLPQVLICPLLNACSRVSVGRFHN
jgi:hypothetical protein